MTTHFLPAGFLLDELAEIERLTRDLERLLATTEAERARLEQYWAERGSPRTYGEHVASTLEELRRRSREAARRLAELPCEPLIYTGQGSTAEVIAHLERLLAADEPSSRAERRSGT